MKTWHKVPGNIGRFVQYMTKDPVRFLANDMAEVFATQEMMDNLYDCLPTSEDSHVEGQYEETRNEMNCGYRS